MELGDMVNFGEDVPETNTNGVVSEVIWYEKSLTHMPLNNFEKGVKVKDLV